MQEDNARIRKCTSGATNNVVKPYSLIYFVHLALVNLSIQYVLTVEHAA